MSKQHREEPHEDEKPLKKARYLWEVKGKHHLKESYSSNPKTSHNVNPKQQETSDVEGRSSKQHVKNCENKTPCHCWQQFLLKSENILDNMEDQIEDEDENFPPSLIGTKKKSNDYYLRKWQARQIARGFVDNTINSVLESWTTRPDDIGDFVENCRNDGQVEDDAILMAIQEHGLQSTTPSRESTTLRFSSGSKEQMTAILVKEISEHYSDSNSLSESGENFDFMNEAVSVAIEKKGLSYSF